MTKRVQFGRPVDDALWINSRTVHFDGRHIGTLYGDEPGADGHRPTAFFFEPLGVEISYSEADEQKWAGYRHSRLEEARDAIERQYSAAKAKTEQEIRDLLADVVSRLASAPTKTAITVLTARAETLRWVLGEEEEI